MDRPIFISDASAEAERLTAALRSRGYRVTDVPLSLLAGRVTIERPSVVVCDLDAEEVEETVRQLGALHVEPSFALVFVGAPESRVDGEFSKKAQATFRRPVDIGELLSCVEKLAGPPPKDPGPRSVPPTVRLGALISSSRPPTVPVSVPATMNLDAEPVQREPPPSAPPLPADVDLADAPPRSSSPHAELSEEIAVLLQEAERRVHEQEPAPAAARESPSPEEEIDAELPADVLVALEESIDEDEDEVGSGADSAPESASHREGTSLTSSGGAGRETSAGAETAARRPALGEGGTSITESGGRGRTASRGITGIEDNAPVDAPSVEIIAPGEDRRARQEAATPKPPRPPTRPPATRKSSPPTVSMGGFPPPPSLPSAVTLPTKIPGRSAGPDAAEELPEGHAGPSTEPSTAPPPRASARNEPGAHPQQASPARPAPEQAAHPELPPEEPQEPFVPKVLNEGAAVRALAAVIRSRFSGALVIEVDQGIRRVVFREGDFVTAASGVHGESLVAFLVARGDLPAEVAREAHKLPMFGRHAGAALIAQGYLAQDQLWSVLRAHAEWIVSQIVEIDRGTAALEYELPGRLREEPAVFGGATGAEVLVEIVRRVVAPEVAAARLGGWDAELATGPAKSLLGECALQTAENELIFQSAGTTVQSLSSYAEDPSFTTALYALAELGVLSTVQAKRSPVEHSASPAPLDELDETAFRARIAARKALVDEGDYFAVLGVSRQATGYDIRRAYLALRRELDPARVLTAKTADLQDDIDQILEVLNEAYEILKDQNRRERYRRAIEATPG